MRILQGIVPAAALILSACAATAPAPAGAPGPAAANAPPCDKTMDIPPGIVAAVTARFERGRTSPPPPIPPEDLAAYQAQQADQRTRDWANICRFRAANAALMQRPASERRVVFMGDSITQNWGYADAPFFSSGNVNRGISGQTTPQMLLRFRADVIALKPEAVHIMAGVNDIAGNTGPSPVEDIEANIASMVELARANGVEVVLATVLPADTFTWAPALKPAEPIRQLNTWIRSYAAANDLVLADYYPVLTTPSGGMKPELGPDGVHPNLDGYAIMAPITRAALDKALAK